ncbi:MAG TPA: Asp23/Gls24 family envelope stress response protein [Chloroflexia bacterium]|nr:Asp23/Gls24 family envelope stress response protein [Chloroflexia bacterium]
MKKETGLESYGATTGQTPPAPAVEALGKVEVSPEAIANIAAQAIMEKGYGVVGLAARRLRSGKAEVLRPDQYRDGIQIRFDGEEIILDLYVIIEYGLRVSEVAHNIMSNVKFEVERHLGRPVAEVNINVQGLSSTEASGSGKRHRKEAKEAKEKDGKES